ncbi:c-type cytochrome [Thalassoglobus neptunius]|nr:c-type cytochrome [Thalassoglobus neptunius]
MPATEQYWRNLPTMHKVFAGSAIALLGATLLMMYKDENRSWRDYQREAERLQVELIDKQRQQYDDEQYQAQIASLTAEVESLDSEWQSRSDEIAELEKQANTLKGRVEILATESKTRNAERDKARADYDIKVRDQSAPDVLAQFKASFDAAEQAAREAALEYQTVQAEFDALKSQIASERRELDEAATQLSDVRSAQDSLAERRNQLRPESWFVALKRSFKELPIINGFNPHLKIQYDWPSGLEQELGMVTVERVDRCRTCHVNIDDFSVIRENGQVVGMTPTYPSDDYEEPFCSHPSPDVYLTATSPHPVNDFGCTVCHGGDGSGTSFQNAEHSPSNPAIAKKWEEEYDWHSNHFWEDPMHPEQFIESSCLKCHHSVVELGINEKYGATAPKLFKGWETIRDYGCFGCHEINGYGGTTPVGPDFRLEPNTPEELAAIEADPNQIAGEMRKVGPSLRYIASKTTEQFIAYWTEEPKRFRPTTRMPQFFDLTNQHDAMAELLQPVEIAGITRYLLDKSEEFKVEAPASDYTPDPKRGEELFAKRGCLACHSKEGEAFEGIDANFGPDLSRIHEKIKPGEEGFQWMYTWIKEPSRYHARTRMPDLYLDPYTDELSGDHIDPAADITAYLLQGGPGEFPELPQASIDLGLVVVELSKRDAEQLGLAQEQYRGVLVDEVVAGTPASRAEAQSGEKWRPSPIQPGDILISVAGTPVGSVDDYHELLKTLESGEEVQVKILRNGREVILRVTAATPLDDLVRLYLSKVVGQAGVSRVFENRKLDVTESMYGEGVSLSDYFKGDEIELAPAEFGEEVTPEEWKERQLVYVGRRTISRYGCYGCHDIPGFENARPIGAALNDWGRKDTSKLAFEHIHEYLHHHGEMSEEGDHEEDGHDDDHADSHGHDSELGTSTAERMEQIVKAALAGGEVDENDLTEALLYKSAITHGRPGFLWQKLRQPRSYDYKKTETKNWDERLRMPKFPFDTDQIEAVSTFVLGLIARPPAPEYQFRPDEAGEAIFEGERLLAKYNCTGCHVLEMDSLEFSINPDLLNAKAVSGESLMEDYLEAFDLLAHIKPMGAGGQGATGETTTDAYGDEEAVYRATAFVQGIPDPEEEDPEFRIYSLRFWDGFEVEEGKYILPGEAVPVTEAQFRGRIDGRGGDFGKWLVNKLAPELSKTPGGNDFNAAWQASVPTLVAEGHKVRTPWLYEFLKNPEPLRRTTVLRMPRFNMSDEEARTLSNYFSAKDGVPFPYQLVPQNQQGYQELHQEIYEAHYPDAKEDYLTASWYVLNGPLCRKCHNVGGNVVNDPKQVKGPNLQRVEQRLRPEWTQLWIYKPNWIYPYTAMPENFPADKPAEMKDLFGGDNPRQAQSVIDALFNYTRLIEENGPTTYNPETSTPPTTSTGGAE